MVVSFDGGMVDQNESSHPYRARGWLAGKFLARRRVSRCVETAEAAVGLGLLDL
jgi:hypothetical protein